MLELDWVNLNKVRGETPPIAYVHGELFGVVEFTPCLTIREVIAASRLRTAAKAAANGTPTMMCVDGVIKLSVNGKFVNGISRSSQKKGYLCLESEGAPIRFRNIRILELPPGVATPEQSAPVLN